jgi:hypothetical protein
MKGLYDLILMLRGRGYHKLENVETTVEHDEVSQTLLESHEDQLYVRPFPRKEIIVGICMLVVGTAAIGLGALIHFEHLRNDVPGAVLFQFS